MNTTTEQTTLQYRSVWTHKRRPITAVVNRVVWSIGDVQVLNDARTHLRYLSIKGFFRDYEPTGKFETVSGELVDSLDDA